MKRRRFLIILSSVAAGIVSLRWLKPFLYGLGEGLVPRMPGPDTTGSLSPGELATLLAYTEVLSDISDFSEETRQYLRGHINDRTENKTGYLSLFRLTATFVDQVAGGSFSELSRSDRIAALEKRGLMSCRVHRRECFSPFGRRERTIRALAATDLVAAYYRSAAGWAAVGYAYPRGHCGDLTRYTRAET